jgi:hypothetical protein
MRWLIRRSAVVATATVLIAGAAAGRAYGDSLSLAVGGSTDAGIVVTATGSASNVSTLHVQYFPAGTGGCPNPPGGGTAVDPDGTQINNQTSFDVLSSGPVPVSPGSYQLCGWLTSNAGSTVTVMSARAFTVTSADTLSLAGPLAPVEGQQLTVTAGGTAYDQNAAVYATYKPAGGGCASTPQADTGTVSDSEDAVSGQYSTDPVSSQAFGPGAYLVCVWLVDLGDNQVLTSASTRLDVGPLAASIQLVAPGRVDPKEQFPLSVNATLDAGIPVLVQADILRDRHGTACAANPDGEPTNTNQALVEVPLTDTQVPAGAVSTSGATAQLAADGRYLICAWLLDGWSSTDTPATVAGPIAQTVTVVKPLVFRGLTSQGDKISITIGRVNRGLDEITASDQLRCPKTAFLANGQPWNGDNPVKLTSATFGAVHASASNSIHLRLNRKPEHTFDLSAHLSGDVIRGTFTESGTPAALIGNRAGRFQCTTGAVHFKVRAT